LQGSGTVVLGGSQLTLGGLGLNSSLAGVVSDGPIPGGQLIKIGSGTLSLGGDNTYTGLTTARAGTLQVNGSIPNDVLVEAGATLGGTGTIGGQVDVAPGGKLNPGITAGTLTVGSLSLGEGLLQIDLTSAASFDKLNVLGNVTLSGGIHPGGALDVTLSGGYVPHGSLSFDILDWAGGLSGTFSAVQLPTLGGTLTWDTSRLYTSGILSVVGPDLAGDFGQDGVLDVTDIDMLTGAVLANTNNLTFDLTGDRKVDQADRVEWITRLRQTWFGDANLDGEFNSSDLVSVFQQGEYEDAALLNSTWATGDWNGDGEFNSSDFVTAFQDGGYELGPRIGPQAVPEPAGGLLMGLASAGLATHLRRRRV
jgi:autotransporter-associated beta strand protein